MGMTGLCLADLSFQSADRLAIVPGGNRRYRRFERAGFRNAPSLHVLQKLRPRFRPFYEIKNRPGLGFIDCSSGSVVIIPDNHDIEDVAHNVAAEERIGTPTACTLDLPPEVSGGAGIKESS